jgi:sugar lactone lactonase YvrE
LLANLSRFVQTHPVKHPEPDDFEPDGVPYSMVQVRGNFYAIESNHGELDRIQPSGTISRIADISASQGHIVPTSVAFHQGNFYVGNLNTFPVRPGSSKILRITPQGQVSTVVTGLTTVLGVTFDSQGHLFALETDTLAGNPGPPATGSGKVVCVTSHGTLSTVVSGLTFPTAMTFGPEGALYISNKGFGVPTPGAGQILRISPGAATCH